jgi:Tol biopolymer transport system component
LNGAEEAGEDQRFAASIRRNSSNATWMSMVLRVGAQCPISSMRGGVLLPCRAQRPSTASPERRSSLALRHDAMECGVAARENPMGSRLAWLAVLVGSTSAAFAQTTSRVNVGPAGEEANGASRSVSISNDGRVLAFDSEASNLVAGDVDGVSDVYVRGSSGGMQLVSVGRRIERPNGPSYLPAISANGRYVAFTSDASNLIFGDTNGVSDVFVRDLAGGTTQRVSVGYLGIQASLPCGSSRCAISSDGRYVAFDSLTANFAPPPPGSTVGWQVWMHDRESTNGILVSSALQGIVPLNGDSLNPSVSADGRFVAYDSTSDGLVLADTNRSRDVFLFDREPHDNTRISVRSDGSEGVGTSAFPSISLDGRYVVFQSDVADLAPPVRAGVDVFIHDRVTGTTTRVVGFVTDGENRRPSISSDGRWVAFLSTATNLIPGDALRTIDVVIVDRVAGTAERISESTAGAEGNFESGGQDAPPAVCCGGARVAFVSAASNLVANDGNQFVDVFARDRHALGLTAVRPATGSEAGGDLVHLEGFGFGDGSQLAVSLGGAPATIVAANPVRTSVTSPPGTGTVDVVVTTANGSFTLPGAYSYVAPELAARFGNVNEGRGDREDVLLLNGISGSVLTREVLLPLQTAYSVVMTSPSSRASARFVLYAWPVAPSPATLATLPGGHGAFVLPTPFLGGAPQPAVVWNNLGFRGTLGAPTAPSTAATSLVVRRPHGERRPAVATLQGLIQDAAPVAPGGVSVTNAIVLRIAR